MTAPGPWAVKVSLAKPKFSNCSSQNRVRFKPQLSKPVSGFACIILSSQTRQIPEEELKFLTSIHMKTPTFFSEEREFLMGWDTAKPALIFIWQQSLALSKAPSPKKAAVKSPKVLPPFSSSCPHFGVGFPNPWASPKGKNPLSVARETGSRELAALALWEELQGAVGLEPEREGPGARTQLCPPRPAPEFCIILGDLLNLLPSPPNLSAQPGGVGGRCSWNGMSSNSSSPNQAGVLGFLPPTAQFPTSQEIPHTLGIHTSQKSHLSLRNGAEPPGFGKKTTLHPLLSWAPALFSGEGSPSVHQYLLVLYIYNGQYYSHKNYNIQYYNHKNYNSKIIIIKKPSLLKNLSPTFIFQVFVNAHNP